MANPRKFSEKIALHNQKQAEETAAFEEIMREVMGATRNPTVPFNPNQTTPQASVGSPGQHPNSSPQQQQNHHLRINTQFNVSRAGSLPNVNQIGQQSGLGAGSKPNMVDLKGCLNELANGVSERPGSVRAERRNVSPLSRSPHRHSSHNLAALASTVSPYTDLTGSAHHRRSQSPYSTNSNAYLSPPPPDGHWRRTNSDSALHQSSLATTKQMITGNQSSPRRTPAMVIGQGHAGVPQGVPFAVGAGGGENGAILWDGLPRSLTTGSDLTGLTKLRTSGPGGTMRQVDGPDPFLLSASLPDQQLRPRSVEVPGINIYPSQDEANSSDALTNHHHIPISSNTGSLPNLTDLPYLPKSNEADQNGAMKGVTGTPNSPYSTGPDSPFSPTSSNLSPPPPCGVMGNYGNGTSRNQSPRRQTSPGPSPSPTASRRKAHHNVNNLVLGNHRHPTPTQVCFTQQQPTQSKHIPAQAQSYLNETKQPQYSYKSPPRITVEGLAMDTNALSLNGNGVGGQPGSPYNQVNVASSGSVGSSMANTSPTSYQTNQFHFTNSQSYQNFATMGMHRSTTPTDSCSAPTSPASQNISPSNSPELPINSNGGSTSHQFGNAYNSYNSSQQTNQLQHQLEQFSMTTDSDVSNYLMQCNTSMANSQNSNVFYLDSVTLSQFNDSGRGELPTSPHQINTTQNSSFTNDNIYNFNSSQLSPLGGLPTNSSGNMYIKQEMCDMNLYSQSQQQLSNSSHCTTPQTPSSIPDIVLTGPNNLDELQCTTDFVKDLNNSIVNMSNMSSFDSDIFCSASDDLRSGAFDSFDLDSLQILPDIDSNTSTG